MASVEKLTLPYVSDLCQGCDVQKIKKLVANNRGIKKISDLGPCVDLERVDLSHNHLSRIKGIVGCLSLTWLNVAHNNLETLKGVQSLINLVVLNASHNSISVCEDVSPLKNLKALILSSNELTVLPGLGSLDQLNTLVISSNQFKSIDVRQLVNLEKLSLSHNKLRQVPDTTNNVELRELRINDNKISALPPTMGCNAKLQLCDVGNNRISGWEDVFVLRHLKQVRSLNFKGNKLCKEPDYSEKVRTLLSWVVIVDGRKCCVAGPKGDPSKVDMKPPKKKFKAEQQTLQVQKVERHKGNKLVSKERKRAKDKRLHLPGSQYSRETSEKDAEEEFQSDSIDNSKEELHYPRDGQQSLLTFEPKRPERPSTVDDQDGGSDDHQSRHVPLKTTGKGRKPSKSKPATGRRSGVVMVHHVHRQTTPHSLQTVLGEIPAHTFGQGENLSPW